MLANDFVTTMMNVSSLMRELEDVGIRVVIGDDFSEYNLYRKSQESRGFMFPVFDVTTSFVDGTNGFWVCGFNEKDELMHTQAVRLFDLKDSTLGHHFNVHRHKYITPDTTPDPDLTFYSGPESLRMITGRVCYHGDFWLYARGLGGPRSAGVTASLSRILFEMTVRLWEPDYVVGFVPKRLAEKGTHLRYGYSHCEPGLWIGPDQQVTDEDHLVWMDRDDLNNALTRPLPSLKSNPRLTSVASDLTLDRAQG